MMKPRAEPKKETSSVHMLHVQHATDTFSFPSRLNIKIILLQSDRVSLFQLFYKAI